jgi:hypothetical protein
MNLLKRSLASTVVLSLAIANVATAQQLETPPLAPVPEVPSNIESADGQNANSDVQHLTRGPLHEAFAEQTTERPVHGLKAPRKPPLDVNEIAPEVKPEGDDVIWIPGYWYWDDERTDFIWISGVWRKPPQDRKWTPGYWTEVELEFYWVPGFWSGLEANELSYQPEPPASLEAGPSSLAPSDDYFWIPGCWEYSSQVYRWCPGYWDRVVENRVWVPNHYSWTPNGCVYIQGYWDYPFHARGVLFTPLAFRRPVYSQSNYCYQPQYSISAASAILHLFVRPNCHHYYYGDYYARRHQNFHPWYDYQNVGRHYDPFYSRLRSLDRYGVNNIKRFHDWHNYFDRHADYRPPHHVAAQRHYSSRHRSATFHDHNVLGRSINDLVHHAVHGHDNHNTHNHKGRDHWKYERLDEHRHNDINRHAESVHKRGVDRVKAEREAIAKSARKVTPPSYRNFGTASNLRGPIGGAVVGATLNDRNKGREGTGQPGNGRVVGSTNKPPTGTRPTTTKQEYLDSVKARVEANRNANALARDRERERARNDGKPSATLKSSTNGVANSPNIVRNAKPTTPSNTNPTTKLTTSKQQYLDSVRARVEATRNQRAATTSPSNPALKTTPKPSSQPSPSIIRNTKPSTASNTRPPTARIVSPSTRAPSTRAPSTRAPSTRSVPTTTKQQYLEAVKARVEAARNSRPTTRSSTPAAKPTPRPIAKPTPRPIAKPTPRPIAKPTPRPIAKPSTSRSPSIIRSTKPAPTSRPTVTRPTQGSRPTTTKQQYLDSVRRSTKPAPKPTPSRSVSRPTPKPTPSRVSRPAPRPAPKPAPRPSRSVSRPAPKPSAPKSSSRPAYSKQQQIRAAHARHKK